MAPVIAPVPCSSALPFSTTVVVIGGGIIGLTTALNLAERGIPVLVLEKGKIAGEQSSRNLGWIRKMGRHKDDVALAVASDRLWAEMHRRCGMDVGYRQAGIMYIARTAAELAQHCDWLTSVEDLHLDARMLTPYDIDTMAPGGVTKWAGGIYTPSDGRGEPTLASSAIARALIAKGGVIIENCAVRSLTLAAGRVDGVVTEHGAVRCEQAVLAGGLWSRKFLGNLGISFPTLPIWASVVRTAPMAGPTDVAVGAPDFSFRKRLDGGFTITQRGALFAPLTIDHLALGARFFSTLRTNWSNTRLSLGRYFLDDLRLPRRWGPAQTSPFERVRTLDPPTIPSLNNEAMRNLVGAWPVFRDAVVAESWAGMIDVTPDSLPVISPVEAYPGLTVATGFSGHGFGTAPAAGRLAADLLTGDRPIVEPTPYRLDRLV